MRMALGIMLLLVARAQAGAVVTFDCQPCGSTYCFTVNGGPISSHS